VVVTSGGGWRGVAWLPPEMPLWSKQASWLGGASSRVSPGSASLTPHSPLSHSLTSLTTMSKSGSRVSAIESGLAPGVIDSVRWGGGEGQVQLGARQLGVSSSRFTTSSR
jgi:hypothetical protein